MTSEDRSQGGESPRRRRKPTLAERRERRASVEDVGEVLDAAARYLEARPRSEAEVRRRLTSMGFQRQLVEDALTRLVELRYLDDEAFARAWVESRDRARPRGEHALRRELSGKGVERSIVDDILRERDEGVDDARTGVRGGNADPGTDVSDGAPEWDSADERAAARLLEKRLTSIRRETDPRRRRQRAYALLARAGFSPDVCAAVSRRVLDHDAAGEMDPADDPPVDL